MNQRLRRLPSPAARGLVVAAAILLVLGLGHSTRAQELELPSVTETYALENARVVQAPGHVLDSATVLIRDGIIEAVGTEVAIPYDARRIDADTLTVYPGFIDGLSHAGVQIPEDGDEKEIEDPGDPPPDRAGIPAECGRIDAGQPAAPGLYGRPRGPRGRHAARLGGAHSVRR